MIVFKKNTIVSLADVPIFHIYKDTETQTHI